MRQNISGEILVVLECLFLPDWNTIAYICKGGKIYIRLKPDEFFVKEDLKGRAFSGMNPQFIGTRELLFDEVYNYYKENFNDH